jgi:hypothetical protein
LKLITVTQFFELALPPGRARRLADLAGRAPVGRQNVMAERRRFPPPWTIGRIEATKKEALTKGGLRSGAASTIRSGLRRKVAPRAGQVTEVFTEKQAGLIVFGK